MDQSLDAQLRATLNMIPAYTWYATPSGGLIFLNERSADYGGLPSDHPLRYGTDTSPAWDSHIPFLHPEDHEETRRVWSECLRTGRPGEGIANCVIRRRCCESPSSSEVRGLAATLRPSPSGRKVTMEKDLGVWTSEDCTLVLIDYQHWYFGEVTKQKAVVGVSEVEKQAAAKARAHA